VIFSSGMQGGASDLMASQAMLELLGTMHQAFDMIVIDAPPIRVAADAFSLAPYLGGVLLAVRTRGTAVHELANARRSLDAARANVIGTVITYATPE
jgi:Mrp family chromosome partitioning ATPase